VSLGRAFAVDAVVQALGPGADAVLHARDARRRQSDVDPPVLVEAEPEELPTPGRSMARFASFTRSLSRSSRYRFRLAITRSAARLVRPEPLPSSPVSHERVPALCPFLIQVVEPDGGPKRPPRTAWGRAFLRGHPTPFPPTPDSRYRRRTRLS